MIIKKLIIILRLVLTGTAGDGLKSEILPRFPVFSNSGIFRI